MPYMMILTDCLRSRFFFWLGLIFFFFLRLPDPRQVGVIPGTLISGLVIGFSLEGLVISNVELLDMSERSDA